MITLEEIRSLLDCDVESGIFYWKPRRECDFASKASYASFMKCMAGNRAGSIDVRGYFAVTIQGKRCLLHRIQWCIAHNIELSNLRGEIDHMDGNRSNNALTNLRLVDVTTNRKNRINPSGVSNVLGARRRKNGRYESRLSVDGRHIYIGVFDTAEEAHAAYVAKKKVVFPESTLNDKR